MAEFRRSLIDVSAGNYMWYEGQDPNGTDQLTGASAQLLAQGSFQDMLWLWLRRLDTAPDGAGGATWSQIEVHPYLDPRIGTLPWVLRLRTLAWVDHVADDADYFWGFGGWQSHSPPAARGELWGIGFKLTNTGNWFALIQDDLTTHLNADSGVAGAAAHVLMVELDGRTRTVRHFIDHVQVGADFVFSLPTVLSRIANGRVSTDPGWGSLGMQIWNDGGSGVGSGRIYFCPANRDPILEVQTGVPDGDVGPNKPVETLDLAGATFVDVSGSAYVPAAALTHYLSQWQITLAADTTFSSPVQDIVTNTALEAVRHTGLTALTNYIARVRYIDTGLGISEWSDAINTNTVATDPSTGWGACP